MNYFMFCQTWQTILLKPDDYILGSYYPHYKLIYDFHKKINLFKIFKVYFLNKMKNARKGLCANTSCHKFLFFDIIKLIRK